jgi:hypothetical protein
VLILFTLVYWVLDEVFTFFVNWMRIVNWPYWLVDGRLGSRSRGYHPVAPRPLRYGPFVHSLYFRLSSPEALHVKRQERSVGEGRNWARKWPVNLACYSDFHVNRRVFLRAANLWHETDGFTSPPKEGMLRIFSPEKSDGLGRIRTRDLWYQSVSYHTDVK